MKGNKAFTAYIWLEMNYMLEKYNLSLALMEVLGIEMDTRSRIIAVIWHYVKARTLQYSDDPSYLICDPTLQIVFGEDKMKFSQSPVDFIDALIESQGKDFKLALGEPISPGIISHESRTIHESSVSYEKTEDKAVEESVDSCEDQNLTVEKTQQVATRVEMKRRYTTQK
ncbi:SWI/SNF complex component SNF12 [Tanacetum coccineum]